MPGVVAAAVAVGAAAGGDTAGQAVADAYRKLKDLVSSHVGPSSMESPERQLDSAARVLCYSRIYSTWAPRVIRGCRPLHRRSSRSCVRTRPLRVWMWRGCLRRRCEIGRSRQPGLVRVAEKELEGDIDSGWVEVVRSVQNLRRRAGSTRPGRVTRTAGNYRRAARRWRMVGTGVADGGLRRWGRRYHGEHHTASCRPTFCSTQTQPRRRR